MASDWKLPLEVLQREISSIRDFHAREYEHAVVLGEGEVPPEMQQCVPHLYASGGELVQQIVVPLPDNCWHAHFFFTTPGADGTGGLAALRDRLKSVHSILAKIPSRVLPQIAVPSMDNGLDENLVRWMYVLHWLAGTPNQVFHAEIEFLHRRADLISSKRFKPWSELSTVPDLDPRPFLTRSPSDRTLCSWKGQQHETGRPWPEVISSSLTKPVFYASLNAIEMLAAREQANPPARRHRRDTPKVVGLGPNALKLLSHLMEHHRCERDDGPLFTPMDQDEIAEKLGSSQSTVSRAFRELLQDVKGYPGLGSKKLYDRLCDARIVHKVLMRIADPRLWKERDGLDLDECVHRRTDRRRAHPHQFDE